MAIARRSWFHSPLGGTTSWTKCLDGRDTPDWEDIPK
jgi:hypothetical protein